MKAIKSLIAMITALAALIVSAGDSAPFRLDTMEGTRIARDVETISYSTEWDNAGKVIVALDGVTLKEASAPASGDVTWNARNASVGNHSLTYTTYKNGVADKVETVIFQVKAIYTVTFAANGGSLGTESSTRSVTEGTAVGALPTPTRTEATFTGWWTAASGGTQISASTTVTGNVTYYAHWQINQYTATFNANGGMGGTAKTQDYGTGLTAPTMTRTGYTFTGWSPSVPSTMPAENKTYTAQWKINQYTATFNANGGTGGTTKTQNYGTTLTAPSVTREWCTFAGWSPTVPATVPAGNATYTAQWQRWGDSISASAMGGKTMKQLYPSDYATITTVVLEEGILELPAGFFNGCDNVVNLTLPESLREFGIDDLPPKIRASLTYDENGFMIYEGWVLDYQNKDVAKLTVPEGVVGIGRNALADMWGLQTLTLPKSLKHIVEGAFRNCYILDNVVIPDAVETIGDEAFMNCTELQSIAFGTGLKLIGDSAFENCISISSIVFKEGLRIIGDRAFAGPMRLMSVSLPASLESIGEDAFSGSAYITGVTAPTHLKAMSDLFPDSYVTLVSAVAPDGVTNTVGWAFAGCASLTGVTLPDTLVAVGECAFSNCASLAEIGLPNSVVTLGVGAFSCCTNLHTVALSKNLEAIRDRTFEKCPMLDSLVVPASVKSVGANIYSGANVWYGRYSWSYNFVASLTGVYFLGNAPVMDDSAYGGMPDEMSSYVIKGSTGWYLTGSPTLPPGGWPTCNTRAITYWSPNRFSVTFDANGGQPATYAAEQITDTTYSLPKTNPTRNGFRFMGWWTEKTAGAQVTPNTRVTLTKEHTLYAHWQMTSNAMAVQFNPNGGTVQPDCMEYPIGDTYGSLPVPTRIGHRFLGWYTSHVGGVLVTEASEVQRENNELYAHWSPITYLVRFHANGGTGTMADQTFTYDVRQALATHTFARTGFAFSGWATTPSGQVRYAERANVENLAEIQGYVVDLYAVWSGAGYSVRFDSNGGTGLMGNQTIAVGETQNLRLCEFERAGYVFAGWAVSPTDAAAKKVTYFDGQTVRNLATMNGADVPLYAVWVLEGQTVRITFNPNGGSVSPTTRAVTVGLTVGTLPIPVRTGFTFVGWYTAATGGTQMTAETVVTGNVTYYAQWKVNGPIVTFNANGGTVAEDTRPVGKGKAVGTLPKPVRTGYTFKGWYTKKSGGTKIKTTTKVTKNVTYYAQWTANKYTIKFNANGGKGTMKPLSATYGKSVALRANAFKRTYWTFLGWAKTKGAAAVDYVNKQKVKNLTTANGKAVTLYAVWKRNTYTVKFSANDGTGELLPQTVSCGAKTALATNVFTRAGFRFAGWTTKKGGKVVYRNAAVVKDLAKSGKSATLYAVWYPESWAVGTFKGTGTIGGSAATVTLTVGSTGSISGKFVLANKKAYSFKAAAFTEFEEGALRVATTIAYGKKTCELDIAVAQEEDDGATVGELLVIYGGAEYGRAYVE